MKMVGRLIEAKAALFDAVSNDPLFIYTDAWESIHWNTEEFDEREYIFNSQNPEQIIIKNTGILTLEYTLNSILEYSNKRDNCFVKAFLNGEPLHRTKTSSIIISKDNGEVSNQLSKRIKVSEKNSILEIKVKRNPRYNGTIALIPGESSVGLKRERPL